MNYLFVYGTLKNSLPKNSLVGSGKIKGKLFDLGFYPGAIESDDGIIEGVIYDVDDETLNRIDGFEGYRKNDIENSLFVRKLTTATTYDCKEISVYVYYYKQSIENSEEILSGNWINQSS